MSIIALRQAYLCLKNMARARGRAGVISFALLAFNLIASAHATDLVGATAGELGVSPSGSASYSIPIAVPPGTTGLQPKITLQYDSLAGNGPAGMGWSVGGLATITRCPTSINIDGNVGVHPVSYDSLDKFCLNGERLVPVVGNTAGDGRRLVRELDFEAVHVFTGLEVDNGTLRVPDGPGSGVEPVAAAQSHQRAGAA